MTTENSDKKQSSFENILTAELVEIGTSRLNRLEPEVFGSDRAETPEQIQASDYNGELKDPYAHAHSMNLIGLAFSGGGIRSATFNLGVLQALARRRLLRSIDYLSTVSGGGYIGSWLTAWTSRSESIRAVEEELAPQGITGAKPTESERVRFLRRFSNYLTPKMGMFSADTWALISTYLRNLSLNLTIFTLFFTAVFMMPYLAVWVFRDIVLPIQDSEGASLFGFTLIPFAIGVFFLSLNQTYWSVKARTTDDRISYPWYTKQGAVLLLIVLPIFISCMTGSIWLCFFGTDPRVEALGYGAFVLLFYVLSWIEGWLVTRLCSYYSLLNAAGHAARAAKDAIAKTGKDIKNLFSKAIGSDVRYRTTYLFLMLISSAAGVVFFSLLIELFRSWEHHESQIWYVVAFGMPLVMLVLMAIITLHIGLMSRGMPDESREWWSRLGGWFLIFMIIWTVLCCFTFFGLPLLARARIAGAGLLGAGWIGSTIAGLFLGKSTLTGKKESNPKVEVIAKAVPYVFVFGLLLLFSLIVYAITPLALSNDQVAAEQWNGYWDVMWQDRQDLPDQAALHSDSRKNPDFSELVITNFYLMNFMNGWVFLFVFLDALVLAAVLSWRVDPNQFSLHLLYRNRLTRCYLGASHANRSPQPATGFDTRDDLELGSLKCVNGYLGPYPIINTTLNLVTGRELAWQQRKGASFIFTPHYCGYELNLLGSNGPEKVSGYQSTADRLNKKGGILLGETMAISGAAASPNMGYHSSAPLAFLMTIFNVRLGWWSANPHKQETWRDAEPKMGLYYLLIELFGLTDYKSNFVYLSDGGHFENLGIYELVRRRCRIIIVSDAGCDPESSFDDLANAIRKIRVDLGISINIKLKDIKDAKKSCVVGDILYAEKDADGSPVGKLMYLKPVICGGEPVDVLSYKTASGDSKFPHQTTADQWFDETQFESYRMLGYHTVESICKSDGKVISIDKFVAEAEIRDKANKEGEVVAPVA